MWKASNTLNKRQRILIAAWWHSLQIWDACYAAGCQALIRALVLLQIASSGWDLPRCNCRGAGLVPKYSYEAGAVTGLWWRDSIGIDAPGAVPFLFLSPPLSVYDQRQEGSFLWKKKPHRSCLQVTFPWWHSPTAVQHQICLCILTLYSPGFSWRSWLDLSNWECSVWMSHPWRVSSLQFLMNPGALQLQTHNTHHALGAGGFC